MSMLVADRFDIAGRGVGLTGQLEGSGVLRSGDTAVSGTGEGEIIGVEAFQSRLAQAEAGANVGLNLGPWAPGELAAGARVTFRARPEEGVPTLGADGAVVPTVWRTLVGYSSKSRAMAFTFGVLAFDRPARSPAGQGGSWRCSRHAAPRSAETPNLSPSELPGPARLAAGFGTPTSAVRWNASARVS
jgi:hypothetical protein